MLLIVTLIIAGLAEEMLEEPLRGIEKIPGDQVVFRFAVSDLSYRISVKVEEDRAWVAENDGRVGGDKELGVAGPLEIVDDLEKGELPLGRERRLRLVEDVDTLLETVHEERQERLAVGLLVERLAAVGAQVRNLLDVSGEVIKTLGAQEETFHYLGHPREPKGLCQVGAVAEGREVMIAVSTLGIESTALCDRFKKC